jgi:hypothetical protein
MPSSFEIPSHRSWFAIPNPLHYILIADTLGGHERRVDDPSTAERCVARCIDGQPDCTMPRLSVDVPGVCRSGEWRTGTGCDQGKFSQRSAPHQANLARRAPSSSTRTGSSSSSVVSTITTPDASRLTRQTSLTRSATGSYARATSRAWSSWVSTRF